MYSNRILKVEESTTLKLNSLVGALKKQGEVIYNLTAGEPDFNPPKEAVNELVNALEHNKNKYTPVGGIPELRQAIAQYTNKSQPRLTHEWKEENVIVSNGAKHALYNALSVLLNEGDEVLIPTPYWLSYPEMVKLAGGSPCFIETKFENNFKFSEDDLRKNITNKTKVLILNSPSNPTGIIYSEADYQAIVRVVTEYKNKGQKIWIFSDEIYDQLIYSGNKFCSFLNTAPELQDQVVTFNGMSKSFAMTGWRVGWSVAPKQITQYISNLQGQSTSGVNSLAQWAAFAALNTYQSEYHAKNLASLEKKRRLVLDIFAKCRTIKVCEPGGAFYFFLDVGSKIKSSEDSIAFAESLLKEKKVAVVPGAPFGAKNFIRISFATDEKTIKEACSRIVEYMDS